MTNLITLSEYKEAKGISKSDDDVKLQKLIDRVSSYITEYLGFPIVTNINVDIVENISIEYETNLIYLDVFPVTQVISVTEADYLNSHDSTVHLPLSSEIPDYIVDLKNGRVIRKNAKSWALGYNSVTITYRGGVSTPPEGIKLAVIDLVTYYLKEEYKVQKNIGTSSINNPETTIARNAELPSHIKRVLDLYRINNGPR